MKYREIMIAAAFSLVFAGTNVAAQENIRIPAAEPTDQILVTNSLGSLLEDSQRG